MFIASMVGGLLIVGWPVSLVFGTDVGAIVGLIAGVPIYLWCLCPHCGKAGPPLASVCSRCGRERHGDATD
jgi:hypothetical protein